MTTKKRRLLFKQYVELKRKSVGRNNQNNQNDYKHQNNFNNQNDQNDYKHQNNFKQLERLAIVEGDYKKYEYKKGDIVYCDPPYEDTAKYKR